MRRRARGVDPVVPFGSIGTAAQVNGTTNVGPIAAPASIPADGAAIVIGMGLLSWTDAAVLSGGPAWSEAWDETTAVANAFTWVMDYAIWAGGAPPMTSKTFSITGGGSTSVTGQMWMLNALAPPVSARRHRGIATMPFPPFP